MSRNRIALAAGGLAVVVAGALGVAALGSDDPTDEVEAIDVGAVSPSTTGAASPGTDDGGTTGTTAAGSDRRVVALEELTGTLERTGDDADDFAIGRVEVDFGPDSWVLAGPALEDFDGDGTVVALADELEGLVGSEVTLLVRYDDDDDDDRDDADVYGIGDLPYRDTAGGPPPWRSEGVAGGADRDALVAAAEAAVGAGSRLTELEPEDGGTTAWEAEVDDAAGEDHRVLLGADASVIDVRRDD